MSHQTLISSSFLFSTISSSSSPSSPSSLPLCLLQSSTTPYYQSSQVLQGEKETRMEALKSSSLRHEACTQQQQQQQSLILAEEMSWAVERGNALGEVFSIDDLLDLGEFSEPEKEEGEEKHEQKQKEQVEGKNSNPSSSSSSPELSSPHEIGLPVPDAAELEWVSLVMDDTLSEFPPLNLAYHPLPPPQPCHGRSQEAKSPTKATICALSTEALVPMKSKRSKRTRATSWSLSGYSSSSSSSSSNSTVTSSSSSSTSSILLPEPSLLFEDNPPLPKKHKPKKRGRKPKISPPNSATGAAGERRCSHCGVQKTPQWRAGPEGAKTLCNACGVRYKSGRLLPEYRPACSPTFVSDVHSNSHRKVLEMRRQKGSDVLASTAPPVASF